MGRSVIVAIGLAGMMTSAFAQLPSPTGGDAYLEPAGVPSRFPAAVTADHAMVVAAHPLAAGAGVEVLRAGGNAIDATVAVQMALNVVEPQSSGIGGGCFIVYYDAKSRQTYCVEGREECPAAAKRSDFLDARGNVIAEDLTGGLPVGVPGTVAAMWLAHGKWGRLPVAKVLAPAIQLADEGFGVSPRLRLSIQANQKRFLRFPSSKHVFLRGDGLTPEMGEVLKQPDLARTLRLLADQGPAVFYEGEIARDIVRTVRKAPFQPGRMSLDDLKNYRAVLREPVRFRYRGYELVGMPPPSSGGVTLGLILGMLESREVKRHRAGSLEEIELLARVSNAAFADRNAFLGDQDWCDEFDMRSLLDSAYVRQRSEQALSAKPGEKLAPGKPRLANHERRAKEGDHTSHFSIVDPEGNVVACTTTIEHGMGSALVVEGRGFLLNNELTDFGLDAESGPNALDASRRPRRTAIRPLTPLSAPGGRGSQELAGKRPRSSMTPTLVFRDAKPVLAVGSPGGTRIIGSVAQVLVNVLDHGMDAQQAVNAPRMLGRNGPLSLEVLYPNRRELVQALEARGWKTEPSSRAYDTWGDVQAIRIRPDGKREGGADPRREAAARGY